MNKDFTLKIPSGWKQELEDSLYNIYNPDGNGAVQISVRPMANNRIDLIETLRNSARVKNILIVNHENSAETKFLRDSSFWKMKVIKNIDKVAFLTYNCYVDNIDVYELKVVDGIFRSFKFKDKRQINRKNRINFKEK